MRAFFRTVPVVFLVIVVMAGCKTVKPKPNSPEGVATRFMKYFGALEFDQARKLGTENTNRLIDLLETMMDLSKDQGADGTFFQKKDMNIEIVKTAVEGNSAVVTYLDVNGNEQTIDLVREKGKWLVDMKKEAMPKENVTPQH